MLERRNPLPPGRYWTIVPEANEQAWTAWVKRTRPKMYIEVLEPREGGAFYLFVVKEPVTWEGPGLPTIAEPGVDGSEDVEKFPAAVDLEKIETPLQRTLQSSVRVLAPWVIAGWIGTEIVKRLFR